MNVMVIGNFIMTGGSLISEESVDGLGVPLQSNSPESKILVTGGEIYGSQYGAWITSGNVIISGDAKITGAGQYAIRSFDSNVVISGTPTISGGTGEFILSEEITLNTQPIGDTTWRVSINTGYNSGIENGVFAIPGDGVTLDPAKFTSLMDGYEVKLNKKNELVLCNHSSATTAVSNGNGTHNTTCDCNETTIESNIACSGGVATATHLAVCAYCGGTYGELDANVNYDIIATAMTAAELKDAVAAWLADGNTDISILLAAYADEEMFTAVKTALAESTVTDGSINLTIAGVKTIPDEALSDYPISIGGNKLKTLTLTDAETTGENEPFARCTYLESVSLPNATTIGEWAFNECSNLTSVYCPKVTVIGGYAFRKCAKLTTFDFTNITTIGNGAFSGCDFNTIVLPEATSIGGSAFVDNPNLVSFSAPKATSFGWYPWGAETIETSKLESLELTAAGEFTIENNFSAYTPFEQINLVLNIDKKDQVTQKDDGTATWTYPYTNSSTGTETKTFKSITLTCVDGTTNHTYQYTDVSNGTHKAECTVEGCGFYKYEAHTPDAEGYTVNDDSTHSFTCSVCNATVTEDHTVPYTLEFQWGEPYETDDGKECYVEGNLLCQDCGESVAYDYGYGKLTSSTEGTDCMNPEKEMYEITLTLNDTEYTDIHTVIIPSDNHTGEFVDGFCTDCGGYQNPDVNPGEDPEWEYDDIYLVENAGQLFWIANYVNNVSNEINVLLTTDITIPEGKEWTPIMNFYGTFDGGYYTVSGLDASGDEFVGMFGGGSYAYGTIKNLHITNSRFEGTSYVGALAGYHAGNIYNCYVDSSVTVTGDSSTGLLVGHNAGAVQNCYAYGSSCVGYYDGNYSTVENCYYLSETETKDGGKTAEQFASGEVAYLLQQGNTEQVWGQDNNQAGATPVFDATGLYKVVTVGGTGNYSVANVGDTNGDGTVDASDYQALVNKALADDHEQIETASYDDIVKYDLDGDGYLDVIDAYLLHLFINGFTTVDVYAVGDYDLNGKAFEEADIKAIKHAIENPEKLATYKKYASDINGDGKLDENDLTALNAKYGEVTGTECADNVKVYYRWGNNYSTCTATAMCTLCGEKVATETVNTTSETLSESTCTQGGKVKYIATFQNELFEEKIKTVTTDMLPHNLSDGVCTVCGIIDATAMSAEDLNVAVSTALAAGQTNIEVGLAPDAPAEMITAIRRAICDTEGVADGSIHLTLKGVTSIPGTTNWAGVAFGLRSAQWDENNVEIVSEEYVTQLASVNLPDVTEIGAQAFYGCSNLASVTAPKVQTIGMQAFGYTALTSVEFPELTMIPYAMFGGTWTLSSAKFPKVTTIEDAGLLIGGQFRPENNPTPFPLELTAEGDITFNGSDHFNVDSQNYSGKVDLVLCCDKKDAVTFHEDGTAIWQVSEDLGYTFKSITFKHSYVDGKCTACGEDCAHTGGTATCTTPAVCEACGVSYGEVDTNNHDSSVKCVNGFCENGCYEPATLNAEGYYEIGNAGQLFWFAQQVNVEGNKEIKGALTANIDLENKPWTPIGAIGEENSFRGVFDGQNYTIRGLNVEGSENGVGFFGEVRTGTVKNFTIYGEVVVNAEVDYVGGVIGSICGLDSENDLERNGAVIQNITSYVNVIANAHGIGMIGGFVGYADHQSLIEKCSWYGTFDAGEYRVDSGAGGFIGKIQENTSEVTIRNCGAYGTIKTNYAKNSYNNTPTIYMGGFLSFSNTGAKTTLENCLFAGRFERGENLTDEARLGAFGTLRSVNAIKNCYYLGDDGLEAVHSDSDLNPGSDNVEIYKVTEDDLRNNTITTQLGEYWAQGEHYPVIKR